MKIADFLWPRSREPVLRRRPTLRAGQSRRRSAPATCSCRRSPRVTLAPAPFVGDRAHRLWRAVLDPLHEGLVELDAGAAFGVQEAADVLRAAALGVTGVARVIAPPCQSKSSNPAPLLGSGLPGRRTGVGPDPLLRN